MIPDCGEVLVELRTRGKTSLVWGCMCCNPFHTLAGAVLVMEVPDDTNITGRDFPHTWDRVLDKHSTAARSWDDIIII